MSVLLSISIVDLRLEYRDDDSDECKRKVLRILQLRI
jgi:hypothetical protein